tara:strand:- start:345 stop:548 length:204 start_codon:yes stop_codon:yes gene_type:complete
MRIKVGDMVCFKRIYSIGIDDLIRKQTFSKYMIVLEIINHVKPACKIMCANGEVNWVAMSRIEKAFK